jgi:hypothetical protein
LKSSNSFFNRPPLIIIRNSKTETVKQRTIIASTDFIIVEISSQVIATDLSISLSEEKLVKTLKLPILAYREAGDYVDIPKQMDIIPFDEKEKSIEDESESG